MRKVDTGIYLFLFLICSSTAQAVEIFSGGERYASVQEYKAKRLKVILRETFLISDEKELDSILKEVTKDNHKTGWHNVSTEQLQAIIDRIKDNRHEAPTFSGSEQDLMEMRQMLGEYMKTHKDAAPIHIDRNKVKTIIVDPEKK